MQLHVSMWSVRICRLVVAPSEGMPRCGLRAPLLGRVPSETYRAHQEAPPAPIILPRSIPTRGAGERRGDAGETFQRLSHETGGRQKCWR